MGKIKYPIFDLSFNCKKCNRKIISVVVLGWRHCVTCKECKTEYVVLADKDTYKVYVKEV